MPLSSMVISRDWQEVSVLECVLSGLHIGVDVVTELEQASAKLSRSKVDAVIVDYDLAGTKGLVARLPNLCKKQKAVPLIISSGTRGRERRGEAEAFVFEKPISVEQAVHTLSAARNMILDARLRYHRHTIEIPVSLHLEVKRGVRGHMMNLSQGGVGIRTARPLPANCPVAVTFSLPGKRGALKARAEIAWTDQGGRSGMRFVGMNDATKRKLQLWLEQQYFHQ